MSYKHEKAREMISGFFWGQMFKKGGASLMLISYTKHQIQKIEHNLAYMDYAQFFVYSFIGD